MFKVLADGPGADEERLRDHGVRLTRGSPGEDDPFAWREAQSEIARGRPSHSRSGSEFTAADYRQIRAQFAGSRWPDLRTAGTDYVDLAVQLLTA